MTGRKGFTPAQMRGLLHRQRGICPECGEVINLAKGDRVHVDHVIPLAMGGTNDWSNLQAIHAACHAAKTGADLGAIAKAKRVARKHAGEHASRHPLPFGRNSALKRRLDGTIVNRVTNAPIR